MKRHLLLIICIPLLSGCWTVAEDGEKVGTVVMVAKEGFFFKTWQAGLIRGRMENGSGSFGKTAYFYVKPGLISKFREAMESNKEVKVKYHQELFAPFTCQYEDNNIADDIQFIN